MFKPIKCTSKGGKGKLVQVKHEETTWLMLRLHILVTFRRVKQLGFGNICIYIKRKDI